MMKKNVLISGGTGFVGRNLTDLLVKNGFTVSILSRSEKPNTDHIFYYKWDVAKQYIDEEAVIKADYIIHLAGENIAGSRWTSKRKKEIIYSRTKSILLICNVLKKNNKSLDAFISASGIGIYGAINGEQICTEKTPPENDFLGITCQQWEASVDSIKALGIRTLKIRTGLVLGKGDGFLSKLLPVYKWGLGSVLGSGKQYMPWIHIDDLCAIYLESLNNLSMKGAYNAAVTDSTSNASFSKTLAKILGYSIFLPAVPGFILKIALGEMAALVLKGRRVSSAKIEKAGFQFQFNDLELALRDCLTK